MSSKHVFKGAIADEGPWACIGTASPLPDPENEISGSWLPFRFDGGQLADQPGDPELIGISGMAGNYGGFADEIDSLPAAGGGPKQFMFRKGTLTVGLHPMSVPDEAEDARFPSLRATPAGRLLSTMFGVRSALATRTVAVTSHDGDGVFTAAATPGDLFIGQILGRDIGGRREASLVTGIAGAVVTHAPHGPVMVADEVLHLAQVWEGNAFRDPGPSVAFKLDHIKGRDYVLGCRATQLAISLNTRRRAKFDFTVGAPIIFTDRTSGAVTGGTNVADVIREPKDRQHATFAATKPRVGPNAFAIDDDATLPLTVAGELLAVDELAMNITVEQGVRGTFDGLGLGDSRPDNCTFEGTIHLSQLPTTVALDALASARDNYHLFVLPMGPTGAHGGALAFYATITSDLAKLDRAKSNQRVALKFRSVSGPAGVMPIRIGLY